MFFGRDAEGADLFGLVKTRPLVVLFAKSGIGKSSLINAGLAPRLEAERFLPIFVRFQNTESSPIEILDRILAWYLNHDLLQKFAPAEADQQLWHKMKACSSPGGETPVFVFDQFEEFFNHPHESRVAFANQLADLVEGRLPEGELAKLQAIPRSERTPEQLAWYTPVEVKFLIAIRSDRLSEINEMSAALPSVLHNRFELRPLTSAQAQQAIEQPAQLDGDFGSPKFSYHPDTLRDILTNLRGKLADEIESFQLQILCGEVEKMVRHRGQPNLTVTPDYLGGDEGIRNILNNYYENQIASLDPQTEQTVARLLIEDQLIANMKRIGVAVETVSLPVGLVEKLLLSRLIRRAPTHLGDVFEISHDTLVAPIVKSRDQRHQIEQQQKLERERLEQEAELAEQRQKLEAEKQLRAAAEAAKQDAEIQKQKAEAALDEAERLRKKAEGNARKLFWVGTICTVLLFPLVLLYVYNNRDWWRDVSEASYQKQVQQFAEAKSSFEKIKNDRFYKVFLFNRRVSLADSIAACERMQTVEAKVNLADDLIIEGNYFEAVQLYRQAKSEGFAGLDRRITNTENFRLLALDNFTRKAETFYNAHAFDMACEYFAKALALEPDDAWLLKMREETRRFCSN